MPRYRKAPGHIIASWFEKSDHQRVVSLARKWRTPLSALIRHFVMERVELEEKALGLSQVDTEFVDFVMEKGDEKVA